MRHSRTASRRRHVEGLSMKTVFTSLMAAAFFMTCDGARSELIEAECSSHSAPALPALQALDVYATHPFLDADKIALGVDEGYARAMNDPTEVQAAADRFQRDVLDLRIPATVENCQT